MSDVYTYTCYPSWWPRRLYIVGMGPEFDGTATYFAEAADKLERVYALVRAALACKGDDVCWRDLYNAEVAAMVGIPDFDPALLSKDQFLGNCDHFHDCLAAGTPYKTPTPAVIARIVEAIETDLNGRKGCELAHVDDDTMAEIRETWAKLIGEELKR